MSIDHSQPTAAPLSGQPYPPLDPAVRSDVIRNLVDVIRARYGDSLTDDALRDIRACLEDQVGATELLHAYPLTNADEPAFVFVPYDGEG